MPDRQRVVDYLLPFSKGFDAPASHDVGASFTMLIILCRDPLEPARPDRSFQVDVDAMERLGLAYILVDHDALIRGDDIAQVIRRLPEQSEPVTAVYRGWMMTPHQYRTLYDALASRNIRLINDPEQYRLCHYPPESNSAMDRFLGCRGSQTLNRFMRGSANTGPRSCVRNIGDHYHDAGGTNVDELRWG